MAQGRLTDKEGLMGLLLKPDKCSGVLTSASWKRADFPACLAASVPSVWEELEEIYTTNAQEKFNQ